MRVRKNICRSAQGGGGNTSRLKFLHQLSGLPNPGPFINDIKRCSRVAGSIKFIHGDEIRRRSDDVACFEEIKSLLHEMDELLEETTVFIKDMYAFVVKFHRFVIEGNRNPCKHSVVVCVVVCVPGDYKPKRVASEGPPGM